MILSKSTLLRQFALLCGILMSGGWLLFPRLPLLAALLVSYLLLCGRRLSVDRRLGAVLVVLTVVLVAALLRGAGGGVMAIAIRFANFIGGLLLLDLYLRHGSEAFRRDLFVITRLMAWQAVVTVCLAALAPWLFLSVDVGGVAYQTFMFVANYHTVYQDSGWLIRPDGFFYEPGVLQLYLNLFLYLSLFVYRSSRHALLALIAVLATQSTTGMIVGLLLCAVYAVRFYINQGPLRVRVTRFLLAGLLAIPLAAAVGLNVADKVVGESRGSFWSRQYDLLTGINVIRESPVLGIGFEYDAYYAAAARQGYVDTQLGDQITLDRGNTNGVVFLLYSIGIPLGLLFLIGMFRQEFFPHRVVAGLVLFLSLLSESMIFTPFLLAVIFSGLLIRRADSSRGEAGFAHHHV